MFRERRDRGPRMIQVNHHNCKPAMNRPLFLIGFAAMDLNLIILWLSPVNFGISSCSFKDEHEGILNELNQQ